MSKKLLSLSLICGFLLLGLTVPVQAAPNMKTGLWEITTTMEMPGMPVKMPPQTTKQCIKENDLVPKNTDPNQKCEIVSQKMSGNTVSYEMKCKSNQNTMNSTGNIVYNGTTMNGTVTMLITPGNTKMTSKMSGKYLGVCP